MDRAKPFIKGTLEKLIAQMFKRYKTTETSIFLDKLKDQGFKYSTYSGITFSTSDVITSKKKAKIIEDGNKEVEKIICHAGTKYHSKCAHKQQIEPVTALFFFHRFFHELCHDCHDHRYQNAQQYGYHIHGQRQTKS